MQEEQTERGSRKTQKGIVVSNKMDKTVVIKVEHRIPHPKYGKIIKRSKKLYAHNDLENVQIGDEVTVVETRPLSKLKRWRVIA